MGIKDLKAKTAGVAARTVERKEDHELRTAPVRMYDVTARMHTAEQRVQELEERLKSAEAQSGNDRELDLDLLVEKAGRKRNLSANEFEELVANLRNNRLVTPISVRATGAGKYEIISGHNRVAAFRTLGRNSIPAFVQDIEREQADIDAFYANLLQPSLPDYEKYLGFCMIKNHRPDMTHEEIADMAGVSRQLITKLMAFAALPSEALQALETNIHVLGANAAADLASLARTGKHDQVIKAVQQLAAGEIDQATAVEQATKASLPATSQPPAKPKAEVRTVKQGKATYCSLRRAEGTIRLEFKSPEEAFCIEQAIFDLLEARANQAKEGK